MGTMYKPQNNGPHTELAATINAGQTSITVINASVLPEAPNVLTIGTEEDAELVEVQSITGNILTVQRGFNGTTAKAWDAGTWIYRGITAQDIEELQKRAAVALTYETMSLTEEQKEQARENIGALASDGTAEDSAALGGVNAGNYLQSSQVVNNFATTEEGFVADARTVAELKNELDFLTMKSINVTSGKTLTLTFSAQPFGGIVIFSRANIRIGFEICAISGNSVNRYRIDSGDMEMPAVSITEDGKTITITCASHCGILLFGSVSSYCTSAVLTQNT